MNNARIIAKAELIQRLCKSLQRNHGCTNALIKASIDEIYRQVVEMVMATNPPLEKVPTIDPNEIK